MPVDPIAEKILEQSYVLGSINTYILGCTDKRVTYNTQQTRAFNLIWALFDTEKIKKKSNVAVVGGGLAGMTAAAALNMMGCKVTLYHDKRALMNIQKDNIRRYIHPNIYDWPKPGCEEGITDFPCMNWGAGNAYSVFEQIEERWEDLSDGITIKEKHIDHIKKSGAKARVCATAPLYNQPYDCVIVAVGFGVEDGFPNTRYVSYWDNDDLDSIVKSKPIKEYLVSGCGDGGLIDTLRIRISDFNHGEFSKSLLEDPDLDGLKEKLLEIEQAASEDEEEFATEIYDAYQDLDIPSTLLDKLSLRLRKDTNVELIGSKTTPMSPKASLINRFSIFLLIKLDAISFEEGRIKEVNHNGKKFIVHFETGTATVEKEYDEVVVRHGPKALVEGMFGTGFKLPEMEEADKITHKAWPDNFYPPKTEKNNQMTPAQENLSRFLLKMNGIDRDADVRIGKDEGEEVYKVLSSQTEDPKLKRLTSFKGIGVVLESKDDFKLAYGSSSALEHPFVLSPGTRVSNEEGLSATLGCFVRLVDQRTAFLSSAHLFKDERSTRLFLERKAEGKTPIGTLLRKTKLRSSADQKKLRNVVDAALVLLNTNIPYSKSLTLPNNLTVRVQGMATAKIGDQVFKYGAGSGMTNGEVTGIHSSIIIEKDERKYYFEDAIMVHGIDTTAFASSGDSGAMVFREDGKILGMIFATSKYAAVLCPIEAILKELQCSLLIY